MNCTACGKELGPRARFCSQCGQAVAVRGFAPTLAPRLFRHTEERMLGGVCAGIAQHFGWDVTLVRLALLAIVLCGFGAPVIAYFVAWIVIPKQPLVWPCATPVPPASGPRG
ncbi:MAG: PspC domain-containing protein [Acidobacteriaceae bacterium]